MKEFYSDCTLCPRECYANRSASKPGFLQGEREIGVADEYAMGYIKRFRVISE